MPYYCTVPRCTSMAGKAKNVSFHQFPRDLELARLWNDVLKRGKPYTKYSKVCSLHFKPDDYTITSVGKNKGQWRTLRKDAVPSQNLPSDTPLPYSSSRKQWGTWSANGQPNTLDPTMQVAQAIYMQTMLCMQQAATATAAPPDTQHNGSPADLPLPQPLPLPLPLPHTSSEDIRSEHTSFKCTDCTKCFKDPDVFILHKRSHTKHIEKENYNMNVTLRSNPILANLLKTNNETNFDPNVVTMENILMSALAANMDYIRNYTIIKEEPEYDGNDERGQLNNSRDDFIQARSDINHSRDHSNDRGDFNHDRSDLIHPRGDSNGTSDGSNAMLDLDRLRNELKQRKTDFNHPHLNPNKGENEVDILKHRRDLSISIVERDMNDKGVIHRSHLNHEDSSECDLNRGDGDSDYARSHLNHIRGELNNSRGDESSLAFTSSKTESETNYFNGNFYRERCNDNGGNNDVANDINNGVNCDNDLNESMDSTDLVIDETV